MHCPPTTFIFQTVEPDKFKINTFLLRAQVRHNVTDFIEKPNLKSKSVVTNRVLLTSYNKLCTSYANIAKRQGFSDTLASTLNLLDNVVQFVHFYFNP